MELRYYYDILRKRLWVILLVVVVATAGVTLQLAARPEFFTASATVMVTPRVASPTGTGAFEDPGFYAFQSGYRNTILSNVVLMIQSRTVMERVYRRLGNVNMAQLGAIQVVPIRGTDFLMITANLDRALKGADVSQNLALQAGDVIFVPEKGFSLGQIAQWLNLANLSRILFGALF